MRACMGLGFERFAWALRRLHCPVSDASLVLEVGSGGNPYARSNVLLDAYEETRERHWVPLTSDRPTVMGFVENLPFRDKSFDFVIASHVLEHSPDPEKFLSELQRVALAGYIEVPDAFMERINPYRDHRLEVTVRNAMLVISKKTSWMVEPDTVWLYEDRAKELVTGELIRKHPFSFHVRFYWENSIPFEIVNPRDDANWMPAADRTSSSVIKESWFRSSIHKTLSSFYSQPQRNKLINLMELLQCPKCKNTQMRKTSNVILCHKCSTEYFINNSIPIMKL